MVASVKAMPFTSNLLWDDPAITKAPLVAVRRFGPAIVMQNRPERGLAGGPRACAPPSSGPNSSLILRIAARAGIGSGLRRLLTDHKGRYTAPHSPGRDEIWVGNPTVPKLRPAGGSCWPRVPRRRPR